MEIGVEMTAEMCTASIDKLAPLLVGHAMQMALNSSNVVGGNVYAAAKEEDAEGEPAREELSEQKEAQSLPEAYGCKAKHRHCKCVPESRDGNRGHSRHHRKEKEKEKNYTECLDHVCFEYVIGQKL